MRELVAVVLLAIILAIIGGAAEAIYLRQHTPSVGQSD